MCGFNPIRDAVETAASLAGNYFLPGSSIITDNLVSKGAQKNLNSPLGQIAQLGSGAAGGGAFGDSLQSAGGALEQSGLNSLYKTVGSGLSDIGNATGLSQLGNDIGNGISGINNSIGSGLSNFADSTGLSSLFGGTAQPTSNFTDAYNGIYGNPSAGFDTAMAAATPFASSPALAGAIPSGGISGASAGGSSGGGFNLGNIGESGGLPSASGLGGSGEGLTQEFSDAVGGTPSGISDSIGSGLGSQFSNIPGTPAAGYGASLGGKVDTSTLSGLFGGGGNSGGGANALNGLLRSLGTYAGTDTNQKGYQGIANAAQQAQANYQPFLTAGQGASNSLADLFGNNGQGAQQQQIHNFQNTPGYQFALDQGLQAVNADAARKGQLLSGNNQQAINNYAQGTANQTYNQYVQNLQNQANQGISAAGGVGTAGLTGANALAQGSGAQANKGNTLFAGLANSLFPSNGINIGGVPLNFSSGNSGLLSLFGG